MSILVAVVGLMGAPMRKPEVRDMQVAGAYVLPTAEGGGAELLTA
ncbi:hypothetical protein ACFWQ1_10800 [Streptomyces albidoflavus]